MEMLCPSCHSKMEAATDPRGGGRRHYTCPHCEGEYLVPARRAPEPHPEASQEASALPPTGDVTLPGVSIGGIPGGEWKVPEELRFALIVLEGVDPGKVFEVTRSRVTVGREEGEILLGDPLVSRKHAAFEVYGSHHIVLKDLASTNGTYLNDRLIAYSKINHGDKIRMGSTLLEAIIEIAG
jgi:FHA domain-containing protein